MEPEVPTGENENITDEIILPGFSLAIVIEHTTLLCYTTPFIMDVKCRKSQVQKETIATKKCLLNEFGEFNVNNLMLLQVILPSILSKVLSFVAFFMATLILQMEEVHV